MFVNAAKTWVAFFFTPYFPSAPNPQNKDVHVGLVRHSEVEKFV